MGETNGEEGRWAVIKIDPRFDDQDPGEARGIAARELKV